MDNVPEVLTTVSSGEDGGINLTDDGLSLAVGEDGFAYIINMPVGSEPPDQIMSEAVSLEHGVNLETKCPTTSILYSAPSYVTISSSSELVLANSVCGTNVLTTHFSVDTVNSSNGLVMSTGIDGVPPIEIQYLNEGVFLHEGEQCEVENFTLELSGSEDVKFDPLCASTVSNNGEVTTDSVDSKPEVGFESVVGDKVATLEEVKVNSFTEPAISLQNEEHNEENKEDSKCDEVEDVKPEIESLPVPVPVASTNHVITTETVQPVNKPAAPRVIRTYGKPRPPKPPSLPNSLETPVVPKVETCIDLAPAPPVAFVSSDSSPQSKPVTLVRVAQVHVKAPNRISIPIPARKRRLIVDAQKQITNLEYKRQLKDTKDIVHAKSELAPGTRQAMKCLEFGGVAQFFSSPGRPIKNKRLSKLFLNNLMVAATGRHVPESKLLAPLTPDLRIPGVSTDEDDDVNNVSYSSRKQVNQTKKRLICVGKPVPHLFRGLRKPPIFKEYKKIQRKANTTPNGIKKTTLGAKNVMSASIATESETSKEADDEDPTDKIEEVVYTVDGESVVLKSHGGINVDHSPTLVQSVDDEDEDTDCMVLESLEGDDDADQVTVMEQVKNENNFEPTIFSTSESENTDTIILEPKTEDEDTMSYETIEPTTVEFLDASNHLTVKETENKSNDLQSDEAIKQLWSFEVSSL